MIPLTRMTRMTRVTRVTRVRRRVTVRTWPQILGLVFVGLVAFFSLPLGALPAGSGSTTFPALRSPVCDPGLRVGPSTVHAVRVPAEARPATSRVRRVLAAAVGLQPAAVAVTRSSPLVLVVADTAEPEPRAVCPAAPVQRGPPSPG
jgi:hypothetical protein